MFTTSFLTHVNFGKNSLLCPLFLGLFFSFSTAALAQNQRGAEQIAAAKFVAIKDLKDINQLLDLPETAEIQSFELTYHKKDADPVSITHEGGTINEPTLRIVQWAVANDTYYFDNLYIKEGGEIRKTAVVCRIVE